MHFLGRAAAPSQGFDRNPLRQGTRSRLLALLIYSWGLKWL
jgi:hypothetical protein